MTKILITGSRTIKDKEFIFSVLEKEINNRTQDIIVQGGAIGVDSIAKEFCNKNNIICVTIKPIYPEKKEYYLYRNVEMIGICDKVIAFWDGKSRGTEFTINYAKARKMEVKVFKLVEDLKEKQE